MIKIDVLKNHPDTLEELLVIWHEVFGKIWVPDITIDSFRLKFKNHLNDEIMPMTFIALDDAKPVGMCSLRENDGLSNSYKPWFCSFCVAADYQGRGIGKQLMNKALEKAKQLGCDRLYLGVIDDSMRRYYEKLGWKKIGTDVVQSYQIMIMELIL
jgi:GNAT superfamily N-acetyltransferase